MAATYKKSWFTWRVVVTALLLLISLFPISAIAKSERVVHSRAIAISYDNSDSMIYDSDKWCNARYGLEVMAAMLDEQDSLSVFAMDTLDEKISLDGSLAPSDRVQAMHSLDIGVSYETDPESVRAALDKLRSQEADEYYLIVMTDGEYTNHGGISTAQAYMEEALYEGIDVIYVAIGDNAAVVSDDLAASIDIEPATTSTILETMTLVSNRVFGRAVLNKDALSNTGVLSLDVPMNQVIVFSQGPEVSVGSLVDNDGNALKGASSEVKYKDKPCDSWTRTDYLVNEDLHGMVVVYDEKLPAGDYQLEISGGKTTEVYYVPDFDLQVSLMESASGDESQTYELDGLEAIPYSTYRAEYKLLDPYTGKEIDSDLLSSAQYTITVQKDETEDMLVSGNDAFELSLGSTDLLVEVVVDNVRVSQRYTDIEITPLVGSLSIDTSGVPSELGINDFPDEDSHYTVKVSKEDGTAITDEEWALTKLALSSKPLIPWDIAKADEVGVFLLRPRYVDANKFETVRVVGNPLTWVLGGKIGLTFDALIDVAETPYNGSADHTLLVKFNLFDLPKRWFLFYVMLAVTALLLYCELFIKRRLPPLNPYLKIDGGKLIKLPYDKRLFPRGSRKHWLLLPLTPMTDSFKTSKAAGKKDEKGLDDLGLRHISIVAARGPGGSNGFKLAKKTIKTIDKIVENRGKQSINGEDVVSVSVSPRNYSDTVFTSSGSMKIAVSLQRRVGVGGPHDKTYQIIFMKKV